MEAHRCFLAPIWMLSWLSFRIVQDSLQLSGDDAPIVGLGSLRFSGLPHVLPQEPSGMCTTVVVNPGNLPALSPEIEAIDVGVDIPVRKLAVPLSLNDCSIARAKLADDLHDD